MTLAPSAESTGGFSPKAVAAMLAAGLISFAALAVLSAYAPDLRTGGDNGAHALSKSAVGFDGLVQLLKSMGETVVVSRSKQTPSREQVLLILTPQPGDKPEDIRALAFSGPSLIVLPKWSPGFDARNPDWVSRGRPIEYKSADKSLALTLTGGRFAQRKGVANVAIGRPGEAALGVVNVASLQTLTGATFKPVLTDETGAALLVRAADERVYVLSDPDLLNTYGLRDLVGAKTALAVIQVARPSARTPIFFDVTLNGYERSRNLWSLAFKPPFLAATLCALAAALLMGLHAAARFGAPLLEDRAFGLGKRALADNQAALIRMARREARMAQAYAGVVRDRVAKVVGAGSVAPEAALESLLDRLGEARAEFKISALMAESRQVTDPAGLLRLARRLHQWKVEMTRERR